LVCRLLVEKWSQWTLLQYIDEFSLNRSERTHQGKASNCYSLNSQIGTAWSNCVYIIAAVWESFETGSIWLRLNTNYRYCTKGVE